MSLICLLKQEQMFNAGGWLAVALYDYSAANPDELSINADDQLEIVSPDDGTGWLKASKNGKEGLVPSAYVEIIK